MSKKHKQPERRRKVKLPTDSTGEPINVGDLLAWPDGERLLVESLTYIGEGAISWMAEGPGKEEYSDNLACSTIIARGFEA